MVRMGSKPVSLKELAERLGLSPATLSLVINRSPVADSIPQETKDRILAAARKYKYRPNFFARSLRAQRSFTIGVIVPEVSDGYSASVMSGVEDHLLQEGYFYFVVSHRHRADLIEMLEAAGLELQHAIQKVAIPEAQERGKTVHEIIRHFQTLVQSTIDRVLRDERKGRLPNFEVKGFVAAAEKALGDGEPSAAPEGLCGDSHRSALGDRRFGADRALPEVQEHAWDVDLHRADLVAGATEARGEWER